MKQKIEIEVEVPEGQEIREFATHEVLGRMLIDKTSERVYRVDLRIAPEWKPPEFLKEGAWIAMDENGEWWIHSNLPVRHASGWLSNGCQELGAGNFNWEPPEVSDWKESKRQVKHG